MTRRVAIIGAGPSGLAAAKAALEQGLEPTVFEASDSVGGLWRRNSGYIWPDMRTNLSKWTCSFSDFPWSDSVDDFPLGLAVEDYLHEYAAHFHVDRATEFGTRVTSLLPRSSGWAVELNSTTVRDRFDAVIVGSGIFARPFIPPIAGLPGFKGRVLHSAEYRDPSAHRGKRVAIIGGSLSGFEIAAHLADHGVDVAFLFTRPVWILPRHVQLQPNEQSVPIDLVLYRGHGTPKSDEADPNQDSQHSAAATQFERMFGNPGTISEALRVPIDGAPLYTVISDTFLKNVGTGAITPIAERLGEVHAGGITTVSGRDIPADEIIFCTGYEIDLSFLPPHIHQMIEYQPADKLVPYLADRTVVHPSCDGVYFAGLYRGPYFGVIELQARWAAMMISGKIPKPSLEQLSDGVNAERLVRNANPRPQFPHGDYVCFADSIASELDALPGKCDDPDLDQAIAAGPTIPAHYRLRGPNANRELAMQAINSACSRVGLSI